MKNKKNLLFILILVVSLSNLSAYGGVMAGEKNLKVLKTQWFDIIYPETSATAAEILAKGADQVCLEVTALYETEPYFRMPVVITPAVENMNAYWTSYPYNRIVLYDTGITDSLDVFSETFLSTFRHELTHAVTYNLKDESLKRVSKIFGDGLTLSFDMITSGWAEGATVTSESLAGEGRLNNEYAKHMVKQAKLEGLFPAYADVQGASDAYPMGSFYYFNGAFDQWLQTNFGMEKYALFWYKAINHKALTTGTLFKKVYGIKIKEAWRRFYDSCAVPAIPADPVKDGIALDYFALSKAGDSSKTSKSSIENGKGSLYQSLTAGGKKLVYMDSTSSSVYVAEDGKNPVRLFQQRGLQSISLSSDGEFLAAEYLNSNSGAVKSKIKIYSFGAKKWFELTETGLKTPAIIPYKSDYYFVCNKFQGQNNSILIYKLIVEKNQISSAQLTSEIKCALNEYPLSFTNLAIDSDTFVWLKKDGLNYSLCESDFTGNLKNEYVLPYEKMNCRQLSYSQGKIYFSWTKPGTMPRLGTFNIEENCFYLQKTDISGGVFTPVAGEFAVSSNYSVPFVWIGQFYRDNRILCGKEDFFADTEKLPAENKLSSVNKIADSPLTEKEEIEGSRISLLENSIKYNPLNYYKRGTLLPVSELNSTTYGEFPVSYGLPFGLTYVTSNPWGDNLLSLSAGYGVATNSGAVGVSLTGGTDTNLFSYSLSSQIEADKNGFKQAAGNAQFSSRLYTGKIGRINLSDIAAVSYGKLNYIPEPYEDLPFGYGAPHSDTKYLFAYNQLGLSYSTLYSSDSGLYEYKGFSVSSGIVNSYNGTLEKPSVEYSAPADLFLNFTVYIPHLLPVKSRQNRVYNLPARISANLFNTSNPYDAWFGYEPDFSLASIDTEIILYGSQIQKAVPGIPILFANSFYTSVGAKAGFFTDEATGDSSWKFLHITEYANQISKGELKPYVFFYTNVQLGITPNIGQAANSSLRNNLYAQFWLHSGYSWVPGFSIGLKNDF